LEIEAVVRISDISTTESHGINDGSETVLKRERSDFTTAPLPSTDGVSDLLGWLNQPPAHSATNCHQQGKFN